MAVKVDGCPTSRSGAHRVAEIQQQPSAVAPCRWWRPHAWSTWRDQGPRQRVDPWRVLEEWEEQRRRCVRCNALQIRRVAR